MKERYGNIDGLRAAGAVMIVLMHVGANMSRVSDLWIYQAVISKFGKAVILFFVISGFGMCCGYYEKMKSRNISFDQFYSRRYKKVLPFVALLVAIECVVGYSQKRTWIESFSTLTLLYGFLPTAGTFSVLGVGWTLGVEFAFYCMFPFFVFSMWTPKRARLFFLLTIIINILCENYFTVSGTIVAMNILRWLVAFAAGGLIYLFREQIKACVEKKRWLWLLACLLCSWLVVLSDMNLCGLNIATLEYTACFSLWLCYAIGCRSAVLSNRITDFFSKLSLEIYLSHMLLFRVVELIRLERWISNVWLLYTVNFVLTLAATIGFAMCANALIRITKNACRKVFQ